MARGSTTQSNVQYVGIIQNDKGFAVFNQKTDAAHPDAVKRVNKKDVQVYEIHHTWLSGQITDLKFRFDGPYGPEMQIFLEDEEGTLCITTGVESDHGVDFMKRACNFNPTDEVKLLPVYHQREGSEYTNGYLVVYVKGDGSELDADGKPLEWVKIMSPFTQENPGDCPPWDWIEQYGKRKPDKSKQVNWLMDQMNARWPGATPQQAATPTPSQTGAPVQQAPPAQQAPPPAPPFQPEEDDLPY